jgi:hypothetical protein
MEPLGFDARPSAIVPDYQAALDATVAGTGLAVVPE